jgi:hypothetical protein
MESAARRSLCTGGNFHNHCHVTFPSQCAQRLALQRGEYMSLWISSRRQLFSTIKSDTQEASLEDRHEGMVGNILEPRLRRVQKSTTLSARSCHAQPKPVHKQSSHEETRSEICKRTVANYERAAALGRFHRLLDPESIKHMVESNSSMLPLAIHVAHLTPLRYCAQHTTHIVHAHLNRSREYHVLKKPNF